MADPEVIACAAFDSAFEIDGIKLIMPEKVGSIFTGFNKLSTMTTIPSQYRPQYGVFNPASLSYREWEYTKRNFGYPDQEFIVKPVSGWGSKGMRLIQNIVSDWDEMDLLT